MTALSSGAIRYWGDYDGDYDRKANNPVISTRTKYTTELCGVGTGVPCTTSYGRCGITNDTEVMVSFTSWKCYDNNNNALACDAGGITTPNIANCRNESTRYKTSVPQGIFDSFKSDQCGAYLGKPAALRTPSCPYTSLITLNGNSKILSPNLDAGNTYKGTLSGGSLTTTGYSQCTTTPADEYLCQSPVTATATRVSDMCYQVYDTGADFPIYLTTTTPSNIYTTFPVYCQLYDSAVGSTNPTWSPPQEQYTCSLGVITSFCDGTAAGTYTFPAAGSTVFPNYAGYKCVPCWGGFDSRVATGFGSERPRRSILSTDALASLPLASYYGNIGQTSQKLGNCAAFIEQSSLGSFGAVVFWSEADTTAAVRRGRWENSAWSTAEPIWPASMSTTHILGVTYSFTSKIPSLYAISPNTLFIS